jgi:DNA repair protein RAD5
MTDCPEKLTTGASLIVTLHAYLLASAFTPPTISQSDDKPVIFNEGLETIDEKYVPRLSQ